MRVWLLAPALLLAGCGDNPDRVTSLPDENSVMVEDNGGDPYPPSEGATVAANVDAPLAEPAPEPMATPEPVGNAPEDLLPDMAAPRPSPSAAARRSGRVDIRYACRRDAPGFNARFDARSDTASLTFEDGEVAILRGQPAGSGMWYRGDGYELRGKGATATLTDPDGDVVDCLAQD